MCPLCNTELRIYDTKNTIEENSGKMEAYTIQYLTCTNPNCQNRDRTLKTVKHLLAQS